jgi:hypothetical protein
VYEIRSECISHSLSLSLSLSSCLSCFLNSNNHSHFTLAVIGNVFCTKVCTVEICEMCLKLLRHFRPKEEEFSAQMNDVIARQLIEHSKH